MKTSERHLFVLKFKEKYTVREMCRFLKIGESGYYRWLSNQSKRTARELLLVRIKEIISEHPDNINYGINRMHTALQQRGINSISCYEGRKSSATLKKEKLYRIPAYRMARKDVKSIILDTFMAITTQLESTALIDRG